MKYSRMNEEQKREYHKKKSKECRKRNKRWLVDYQIEYRFKNRDKINSIHQKWRDKNREHVREYARNWYHKNKLNKVRLQ